MARINIKYSFYSYPKVEVYGLAKFLGTRLVDFLGEDLFSLLLDTEVLLNHSCKGLYCISEETYKLHPAAKALEGFLIKLIKGKKLQENKGDHIGNVFGDRDKIVRSKIRDFRLIAKTKTVWDYCRNDIMHHGGKKLLIFKSREYYDEIKEIILDLYLDFYGRSTSTEEISEIYSKELSKHSKKMFKKLTRQANPKNKVL